MSIRLGFGANTNITIGGRWNSPLGTGDPAWGTPVGGAVAFSLALAVKPSSLTAFLGDGRGGLLFHQSGYSGATSPFNFRFESPSEQPDPLLRRLLITLTENDPTFGVRSRLCFARPRCFLLDEWNFMMVRWRAAGDLATIYNNTMDITQSHAGVAITSLVGGNSPMEIGGESGSDSPPVLANYFRAAIWTTYLLDSDAIAYGQGVEPHLLSTPPIKYLRLSTYRNFTPTSFTTLNMAHASVDDEISGQGPYGDTTMPYQYNPPDPAIEFFPQGVFGDGPAVNISIEADPPAGPYPLPPPPPILKSVADSAALSETFAMPYKYQGVPDPPEIGWLPDIKILPKRGFSLQELRGDLGKRSGIVRTVSTLDGYRTALLDSDPGDNVRITSTAFIETTNTITLPNVEAQTVNDTTPRQSPPGFPRHILPAAIPVPVGIGSPVAIPSGALKPAGDPSWVIIETDRFNELPDLLTPMRDVPLPDGTLFRGMHEDCAVTPAHLPLMPKIRQGTQLILDLGFNVAAARGSRFCWRGIHFQGQADRDENAMMILGDEERPLTWGEDRKLSRVSDHLMWQQCAFESDPDDKGFTVACVMANCDISYHALVNCLFDKFHGLGPGEGKYVAIPGGAKGPYHWENNHWRGMVGLWFAGGGGSSSIGVNPSDFTLRRNYVQTVRAWVPSEVNQHRGTGWNVTVTDVTVTRAAAADGMSPWHVAPYSPARGHIMYEFATGKARKVAYASDEQGTSPYAQIQLESSWPGAPTGTIRVGFQSEMPDWETSPLLYNSGLTGTDFSTYSDVPRAITVAGSRHVELTHPLPQQVADEINLKQFPVQFYLNNLFWMGDVGGDTPHLWATDGRGMNDGTPVTAPATHDSGWSWRMGKTRAQCKRKRVVSVAANRMSFELDPTQDPYWESNTFPFSMVRFDGLWRCAVYHYKGPWENKVGERFLLEGNVMDELGARDFAVSQSKTSSGNSTDDWIGICSIQGDILTIHVGEIATYQHFGVTFNDPTPEFRGWQGYTGPTVRASDVELRRRWGAPMGWATVQAQFDMDYEYGVPGRIIDYVIDSTHLKLLPKDPRLNMLTDFSHQFAYVFYASTPWHRVFGRVIRYNKSNHFLSFGMYGENSYSGATRKGGQFNIHDNLGAHVGTLPRWASSGGVDHIIMQTPQGNSPESAPHTAFGPGGQANWDEPRLTGQNGHWQVYKNTLVRGAGSRARNAGIFSSADPVNLKSGYISGRDNIVIGDFPLVIPTARSQLGQEVTDPTIAAWDATCEARRNIFGGHLGLASATRRWAYQDNAGVETAAQVGFANYEAGAVDGLNVEHYRLQDILSTGSVAIAADGLVVTNEGGAWPAMVSPGQFFKLPGQPLVQIAGLGGGLGPTWRPAPTGFHKFSKTGGRALPEGGGGTWALQTRIQALNNNQYSEIVIASALTTGGFGQLAQFNAATRNGYLYMGQADPNYAGYVVFNVFRMDAGALTKIGFYELQSPIPGDTYQFWGFDGYVGMRKNGASLGLAIPAPEYAGGEVGLVAENSQDVQFWSFVTGDSTGQKSSEAFTGGENIFTLKTPYPIANVTGQPFIITFRGTATDGGHPGCDPDLVEACTFGVVRAWAKD